MPLTEWVNSTQALVTGCTVIAGGGVAVLRFAQKGFSAVAGVGERLDEMAAKIDRVVLEVTPNGGGSIKDALVRLEAAQKETQGATVRMEAMQLAGLQLTGKAYWLSNPDGECTFASVKLSQLMGATPSQIEGFGWVSYVKKDDRESVKREWDNAVHDQREFHMKYSYIHEDGTTVPIIAHAMPVIHAQTKLAVGMIGWAELDNTGNRK